MFKENSPKVKGRERDLKDLPRKVFEASVVYDLYMGGRSMAEKL